MISIGLLQTTSSIKMWKKQCWVVTTMCVLFELTAAQGNINYSRENLALPIHGIPAPRPAPSEVQVLDVPTTAAPAIVTESSPMTTLAPTVTTRPGRLQLMAAPRPQPYWQHTLANPTTTILPPTSYDPGYFVSKDQLTEKTEVVTSTEPVINSEPYDPGYFISKDLITENTEVVSSTEPAINSETYDPGYFISKDPITENTEVVSSTEPAINSETYDPGYFISKDPITENTEVVSSTEPAINSETYDPGYFISKDPITENTEVVSSTEPAINSETYDPGYFISKDPITENTEVVSSTEPAINSETYDPGYFISKDPITENTEVVSSTEPAINSETYDPGYFISKDPITENTKVVSSTEPAINSETYDPGYFISKDPITENTEVVSSTEPAINSETYDPGYFISKDPITENTEVVSSTEPAINSETYDPGYFISKDPITENTEVVSSTEPAINSETYDPGYFVSTERAPEIVTEVVPEKVISITTELPVPVEVSTEPPRQKPIVWNMSTSRPFLRPLMVKPTQRPIMGRTPIIEGDDLDVADDDFSKVDEDEAEVAPLLIPTQKPVTSYENGHNFEILDKNESGYPLATTTNIAIYQGPSTMTCSEADAYYTLENDCDSFVECRRQVASIYMCPDGLFFNNKTIWPQYPCGYPSEVQCLGNKHEPKSSEECPRQYGFFPLPSGGDCGKYLMCQEGKATIMDCPPGLAFNPEKDSCDWPINVPSCEPDVLKGFECPDPLRNEDGSPSDLITHFSFHNYCKQYIACQLGHPRLLSCDLGYSYDPRLAYCARTEDVPGCNKDV